MTSKPRPIKRVPGSPDYIINKMKQKYKDKVVQRKVNTKVVETKPNRKAEWSEGALTGPEHNEEAHSLLALERAPNSDKIFLCMSCVKELKSEGENYCAKCLGIGKRLEPSFLFPTMGQADAYTNYKRRCAQWLNVQR